jgi:POT family proton-dependent oligopeptide transporter
MDYQGKRYDVIIEGTGDSRRQVVAMDGVNYGVEGQKDGSMRLFPLDAASGATDRILPSGKYTFDGERNPFWVHLMFLSLCCVIVGNGFFKPNISTMVGSLYAPGDRRRDGGFTIFYMGINLGSMISQFLCPLLQVTIGFWAGFLLAAIGMLAAWALIQFDGGRLDGFGEPPPASSFTRSIVIYLSAVAAIPLLWFLLNNTMHTAVASAAVDTAGKSLWEIGWLQLINLSILGKVLFGVFFGAVIGIPIWAFSAGTKEEAQKMVVAVILVVFSVVFWTLFEQAGSSLTLFAERNTDRHVLGYDMPAGQTQIFNPLFIVVLAPVFSWLWIWLARKNLEPSIPMKFAIGLVLVGAGLLAVVYGAQFADEQFRVALGWLVLAYLLHSIGELCLSPVGLSMITKLSMVRVVGLMMGVWFLSSSMAQFVGGIVAQKASVQTVGGEVTNPEVALDIYVEVFRSIGLWGIGSGVALFLLSFLMTKWMHGVK